MNTFKKHSKLILAATLALASFCSAQTTNILPDSPSAVAKQRSLVQAESSRSRTIDKAFLSVTATDALLMAGDLGLSISRISHSHNKCVVEINPIFGSQHPSAGDYAKVMIPITVGTAFLSYELKKHNSPVWALPQAVHSIFSFTGIVSNSHSKEDWPCQL